MDHFPTIKIEIDAVKHTIVQAIMDRNEEMVSFAQQEIDRQLANRDFRKEISNRIKVAMIDGIAYQVKRAFEWHEGRSLIDKKVNEAIDKVLREAVKQP